MLEYIYQWMENITFYVVIMVAVMQLIPEESYKKYIRFFMGMVLILLLAKPIFQVFGEVSFPSETYEEMIEKIEGVTWDGRTDP